MENNLKWVYLTSSNASKEYILDILETLSLPFGGVQHFRYQLKWIDDNLRKKLPKKGESGKDELKSIKVVVCYLYQERKESQWSWIGYYPIRVGTLMDAYKTGDENEDVAHFYFKVDNYISYDRQNFIETIRKFAENNFEKKYAFFGESPNLTNREEARSAFHKICESINLDHFKSPEGKRYFPLFCFIDGLKDEEGKILTPEYHSFSHKSFYKLIEGNPYAFEFMTYSPTKQKLPKFTIKLVSEERIFSTPSVYELKGSSRYDEESWTVISCLLERDIWTVISFKVELINTIDDWEPLNTNITFPIKVIRKISYRIIDTLSDIGFGVGTGSIALSKMLEKWAWWYWPVIIGYAVWAISKLIVKLWRG